MRALLLALVSATVVFYIRIGTAGENKLAQGLACLRTYDLSCAETLLLEVFASSERSREKIKAAILLARTRVLAGKAALALEVLQAIADSDVPQHLLDIWLFEIGRAKALLGDKDAEAALKAYLMAWPKADRANKARLLLAEILLAQGRLREAAELAKDVSETTRSDNEEASALLVLAKASEGDEKKNLLRRIFIFRPYTEAAGHCGLEEKDLTSTELLKRANAYYRAYDYEEYQRILEGLWQSGVRSPRIAFDLALSHLNLVRDDPVRALELLDIAEQGGAIGKGEALWWRARAYMKLEDYERARKLFREFLKSGAKGSNRVRALYYLGWLPYDKGQYEEALPDLERFLKVVKKDPLRSYIIWAKGWSLYKLGRLEQALDVFKEMKRMGNALVAGKALYWGGIALKRLRRDAEAKRWLREVVERYPLTYYAVLAAKRLNKWWQEPLPRWMIGPSVAVPEPEPFWPFDKIPKDLAEGLEQVKDLAEIGEISRARRLYRKIAPKIERLFRGEERAKLLLTVYGAIEDFNTLYERSQKEFSAQLGPIPTRKNAIYWMLFYPRAHRGLVQTLTKRFKIPEVWPYAIMRQESRYRERQVSHTAALGIMQMIPKTGKIVSKALGVPFEVEDFFDPGRNLLFGHYYLRALLKDFKGQIIFASAAYNAGAPPVKKFLQNHKGLAFDEMVEHISYNEARNYCRMVATHIVRYAYLHMSPEDRIRLFAALFPDTVDYEVGAEVNY